MNVDITTVLRLSDRPSTTLKVRWFFYVEFIAVVLLVVVGSTVIVRSWVVTLHPIFEATILGPKGELVTLSAWIIAIFDCVIFLGYLFGRLSIGPFPLVETYTSPVTLPDGDWTELVIIRPDWSRLVASRPDWDEFALTHPNHEDVKAVTASVPLEKLPDLVQSSAVPDVAGKPQTIRIDREALESVFSEARTGEYFKEIGGAVILPKNWSRNYQHEMDTKHARDQLIHLSIIIDNLPPQNVSYD